ncbi:MAG: cytochrome C biosynthesis protein [Bacteroidota bacterium]|nr:cytochrome C biosynthesis protein [Bacteroidota bacterium]
MIVIIWILISSGCSRGINEKAINTDRKPSTDPDYSDITIPPNIAPMNFRIMEEGRYFSATVYSGKGDYQLKLNSSDGTIRFPEKAWKKLTAGSTGDTIKIQIWSYKKGSDLHQKFDPVYLFVSKDRIDPYLAYRLIYPGYYSWSHIRIIQRSIESFEETPIFDNQIMEKNCANCHSFNRNRADRFMIHIRGSLGGTYFVKDGKITRTDPKIDAMPGSATYPSWNPDGRFVAFSSNQVRQSFYSIPEKNIEVFDLVSSLIIYDTEKNEILTVTDRDTTKYLQTFPSWSPDGKYLYYCRALPHKSASNPEFDDITGTHYDLMRKSFDTQNRTFGESEIVFNASAINKSVSFPRISPDGRYLVFTIHDYGTFPIWHQEADLWMLDMKTGISSAMNVNSDRTESYHTWSANSRWLVFSSKRIDGRTARPYFAHIDSLGNQGKPFVLPQKDPSLYDRMLESFNIPEFVDAKIKIRPRDLAAASKQKALKAISGNPAAKLLPVKGNAKTPELKPGEKPVHE